MNAYGTYRNSADIGADGHVWALDAARESMQIWQIGTNTYCLQRHDVGTFTTFAGVSPEGTGTVSGGVTGRWHGTIVAVIHGTFAPTIATRGFVGNFDLQCQQDGTCLGPGSFRGALLLQHRLRRIPRVQRDVRRRSLRCVAPVTKRRLRRHRLLDDRIRVQSTRGSMPPPRGAGAPTQGGSCMKLDTVCRGRWHGHRVRGKLMHRKLVVVAVVGLFAALIVPAAFAGQPTIQRIPYEDHFVSQSCGFPVQNDVTGTALDISYTDAFGNLHSIQAGPQFKQTMTNLVTGKTIVVNISGPGQAYVWRRRQLHPSGHWELDLDAGGSRHPHAGDVSHPGKVRLVDLGLGCPDIHEHRNHDRPVRSTRVS